MQFAIFCTKLDSPVDITLGLFNKSITPAMLYACEVWEEIDVLEKLPLLRNDNLCNTVYGELGRHPLN